MNDTAAKIAMIKAILEAPEGLTNERISELLLQKAELENTLHP